MLFSKLDRLGFGGRTLSLLQSMYHNDFLQFIVNGKYTDKLYLTRGVKQGNPDLSAFRSLYVIL